MGLGLFGLGAILSLAVAADALIVLRDCAPETCRAARAGLTQSGFAAMVMASMAVLAWKRLRGAA